MSDNIEKLFAEFNPISTQEWEEIINKDLKGADYNKKLIWNTMEGFSVKPYYRAEDLQELAYLTQIPGQNPFVRGNKTKNNNWNIVQEIEETDPQKANAIALDALKKGAEVVSFNCQTITTAEQLSTLLCNIDIAICGVRFRLAKDFIAFAKLFVDYVNNNNIDKTKVHGAFHFDPLSYLFLHGKFQHSQQDDLQQVLIMHQLMSEFTHFQYLTINATFLHNCGATIVQELAFALSSANEYLALITDNNININDFLHKIGFTLSISSNYFMEIAKLRSARLLWATIANAYQAEPANCKMTIFSQSSLWNKTIYDPYVNMLRITTEGMSAALGGADSIALSPFDVAYKPADDFSARIARNTQILLKEESYFDKIVDPAAGSYYIENLTNSIAESVWNLFQEIEKENGIIAFCTSGKLKNAIETSCQKRDLDIATRRTIILGTNQYPNIKEEMLDKIVDNKQEDNNLYLKPYRGAIAFEQLRLATEKWAKNNGRPKVFLLKIGNIAMRQARAGFITNFFGCAGYEIIESAGYKTIEDALKDAVASKAHIVAICSSDEEYADVAAPIAQLLKQQLPNAKCIVAGNPTDIVEHLKNNGVDDFIHIKVNLLDTLRSYNKLLGIS